MQSSPPLRHYEIFRRQLSATREMRRVEPPLRRVRQGRRHFPRPSHRNEPAGFSIITLRNRVSSLTFLLFFFPRASGASNIDVIVVVPFHNRFPGNAGKG